MVRKSHIIESVEPQQTLLPLNLPEVFKQVYYYLYTNSNIPRAERLSAEMTRILFCKIYDELHNREIPEFRAPADENYDQIALKVKKLFEKVKEKFSDAFDKDDKLYLDDRSITYIVRQLQNYELLKVSRDVISEAFQAFLGPGLRGEKGQFFTPRNVVKMCVDILEPKPGEKIIDPACGSGGFLVECISRLWEEVVEKESRRQVLNNIFGIDKEIDLARICKAYMSILGDGHTNIFCADSLAKQLWLEDIIFKIEDESFDIVLTNPPFGARISIGDKNTLRRYKLGYKWSRTAANAWKIKEGTIARQAPQVLFIERCLQLLRPNGRMAIVLPDGLFGNRSDGYILQYIFQQAKVIAMVSLAPETFLPSTHTKTSVLFLEKKQADTYTLEDYEIFMAIANKVGHDKNGKVIYKMNEKGEYILDENGVMIIDDDLLEIAKRFKLYKKGELLSYNHLGFVTRFSELRNFVLVPYYYDPEIDQELVELEQSSRFMLMSIEELAKKGVISIKRGHEVGSRYYGMGEVPFIRTSDIANWEIKIDPKKSIPKEIYLLYKNRQDIQENDVLLITDGTFLIGRTAILTAFDKKIVIQSHIRRIRCLKPEILHPYLLLYLLNTDIVQRQIKAKTFVQATISTIGKRLYEIVLPIPRDIRIVEGIIDTVSEIVEMKMTARQKMSEIIRDSQNIISK